MGDIAQKLTGLATAVDLYMKSSEGQRQNSGISKNFENAGSSAVADNAQIQPSLLPDISSGKETGRGNVSALGLTGSGELDKKAPGRPKGARNRSTEEWRRYFLSKHKSPLMVLGELYNKPLEELKDELKCERLEAFKLQLSAAQAVLPYVHQKQPLAIEDKSGNIPVININVSQLDAKLIADNAGTIRKEITDVELVTDAEFSEVLAEEES